jgi:hypothetical protein
VGLAAIMAAALLVLGWAPTRRLAGDEALPAMFVGCAISVVGSLAGTVPVILARNKPHLEAWSAALAAMGTRLAVVIVLGAAAALAGWWPTKPLLLWVAVSHAGLLVPDTLFSIKVLARQVLAQQVLARQAPAEKQGDSK